MKFIRWQVMLSLYQTRYRYFNGIYVESNLILSIRKWVRMWCSRHFISSRARSRIIYDVKCNWVDTRLRGTNSQNSTNSVLYSEFFTKISYLRLFQFLVTWVQEFDSDSIIECQLKARNSVYEMYWKIVTPLLSWHRPRWSQVCYIDFILPT